MKAFKVVKIESGKFAGDYKIDHEPSGTYLSIHETRSEAEHIANGLETINGITDSQPSLGTLKQVQAKWYELARELEHT